jgi:hypothetical protein
MNPSERIDQLIARLTDWRGKTLASVRKTILRPTGRSSRNGSGWEAQCGLTTTE